MVTTGPHRCPGQHLEDLAAVRAGMALQRDPPDRRLLINPDTSVTYLSGSGNATVFAAGTLAAPTGVDAILVKNPAGTYTMTVPTSAV